MILGWFGLVPQFPRGALDARAGSRCQDRTRRKIKKGVLAPTRIFDYSNASFRYRRNNYDDRPVKHPAVGGALKTKKLCTASHSTG
jgi:hypothetical protein